MNKLGNCLNEQFQETKSIAYIKVKYQIVSNLKNGYTNNIYFNTSIYPPTDLVSDSCNVKLFTTGWLRIRLYYAWDGASGPTCDTKSTQRGSLAHDALADLLKEGKFLECGMDEKDVWKKANDLIKRLMREDGVFTLRYRLWHYVLDKLGFSIACKPDTIYHAP